jgi:UDP-2,3-diacylglucosamine hydrolase
MPATVPAADGTSPAADWPVLQADAAWRSIDFISDLHLQAGDGATFEAWRHHLQSTTADAVFMLGDLFEVWVGDDAALVPGSFEARCGQVLREAGERLSLYFMCGNRDFLVGSDFLDASQLKALHDPTVLVFAQRRWLLSHGDALCLDDHAYMAFRAEVRSPAWQDAFLGRPLAERISLARDMRERSEARKREQVPQNWVDVDADAAGQWLRESGCTTLIHGHTHRPADHDLGQGLQRVVLSDWDAQASPPRLQVLRLDRQGLHRLPPG